MMASSEPCTSDLTSAGSSPAVAAAELAEQLVERGLGAVEPSWPLVAPLAHGGTR